MTWISLICLLALTSSAFGRSISAYGSYDGSPQIPLLPSIGSQRMIPKTILPTNTLVSQTYGQTALPTVLPQRVLINTPMITTSSYQQQQPIQQSYGAQMTLPRTLPVQSYTAASQGAYGAVPMTPQLDQPVPMPVLSQADMLCQGHQAEDIIPIENNRKFVICLDKGKGVEQQCPTGLFFHPESRRCERTSGPLDDACSSQPCLNGGQCLSSGSSFQCQCAAGFEGVVCELDARICQTQQPCGLAPDTRCQSFRLGAALPYICIFQNGLAYGLNTQQILPNPCHGTDGPQALAVSRSGFVMCDSERFFVESCPGGTLWDDVEKACSWPDQQSVPQEPKTLPSAYGYGSQMIPQQQPVQSYGSQTVIPQQTQMVIPKQLGVFTQSYGAQSVLPQQPPKMIIAKQLLQPMQSYGTQTFVPPQQQPTVLAAKSLLQPMQSYGAQVPVSQPLTVTAPKLLAQPTQSYGGSVQVSPGQPTMNVQQDVPTLKSGKPYGAAEFPSS